MEATNALFPVEQRSSCYDALNQKGRKPKNFRDGDRDQTDVDITVAIADIGDVDAVGGSFRAKFTVNAFYLFKHSQVMEPSVLNLSPLVAGKRNPFALPPIVQGGELIITFQTLTLILFLLYPSYPNKHYRYNLIHSLLRGMTVSHSVGVASTAR